jgi:hypothetical protein
MAGDLMPRDHIPRHSPMLAGAALLLLLVGGVGYGEGRRGLAMPPWLPVAPWLLFCVVAAYVIAAWWEDDPEMRTRPMYWTARTGAYGPLCVYLILALTICFFLGAIAARWSPRAVVLVPLAVVAALWPMAPPGGAGR